MTGQNDRSAFAREFADIPAALAENAELREAMCLLISQQPIAGKATEGIERLTKFRLILLELARGEIGFFEAFSRVEEEIPRRSSLHGRSNSVFPRAWGERLVRTQFNRFYTQAVLDHLIAIGEKECFVPHSGSEAADTVCSRHLAGRAHDVQAFRDRLIESYENGRWDISSPMIPHHPHCTHVVAPIGLK